MRKTRGESKQVITQQQQSCVVYIRVSSKEQQQEGFSLDSQLKFLNDYARSKGMQVVHTYMDVVSARRLSASKIHKPDEGCISFWGGSGAQRLSASKIHKPIRTLKYRLFC